MERTALYLLPSGDDSTVLVIAGAQTSSDGNERETNMDVSDISQTVYREFTLN